MSCDLFFKFAPHRNQCCLTLIIALLGGLSLPLQAYPLLNLTTNAQPLSGTEGGGDTFPGAVVPFGMIQWSPDTTPSESGGYLYSASQIVGFGVDHMSGAGCDYGGDFAFLPLNRTLLASPGTNASNGRNAFPATFLHTSEIAAPGYYSVQFTNGIRTELTATMRTGFGRFTYPAGATPTMLINAGSGAAGTLNAAIQINTNAQQITGWTTEGGFCGAGENPTLYFVATFDHPFTACGVWSGGTLTAAGTNATGAASGVYLNFSLPGGGTVLARTAISYVSLTNAELNLQTESPAGSFTSAGFYAMVNAASNTWNGYLNKIQVSGGTAADTATFYTMMYHALQAPSVVSDVNGQYFGFDGLAHTANGFTKYEFFSGWDIYRNECQFIALMDPARAGDMAQSLVQDATEGGAMPRWSVPNGDTGVMMGDPATPIIAGIYAFGGTHFNTTNALADMVKAALNPATVALNGVRERDAERDYLNLGFVPENESGGYGPVSMTLEYCSADFALARFAQALGDVTNYTLAMNRAQNWRNVLNPGTGYEQLRRSDSFWPSGFIIGNSTYDNDDAYVEGTAAQYNWLVPFNLASLIQMIGGPQAASRRLDTFFTLLNDGTGSPYAYMGNEPCSEVPWVYSFMGEAYKSSRVVRQVMTQLFSTMPGGLPGNDDLGQMASWYVLAALGLHPEMPGDDVLVLNGPLFPQAVMHLTNGDVTITATGASDSTPYVQSLSVNGQATSASWIRYAQIASGGTLAFTVGATPNTNWGSGVADMPPSYEDGMTAPLAPNYLWGTGWESNEFTLTWTNTVDTAPYPAGGTVNIGPITSGPTGPELGVRSENSQSGQNALMYSGLAEAGATDFACLKAIYVGSQNITVSPGLHFSYWIFPQSHANDGLAAGNNSKYVALDLIFTDGTNLRDSRLTDQHGTGINPTNQASILALDTWNYVSVDLTPLTGKTINRIDLVYNQPNSSGGFRGYVDDVAITTPAVTATNVALNQPASTDSPSAGTPASNANDGNLATSWTASDSNASHWWQVDLGGLDNLTGDEVVWPVNGLVYDYTVSTSTDGTNWVLVVSKTANTSTAQDQADMFLGVGRYVRVTVTGLPAGESAGIAEFRVFGSPITVPPAPAGLTAHAGCGLVDVAWASSPGATNYLVKRATTSGAETIIASTAATNYTDLGLANGTFYYYEVAAVNLAGASPNSGEVRAAPALPAPGTFAAAVVAGQPLAYWPLGETNGSIAYDVVGGYNGTYLGGVTLAQSGVPLPGFGTPRLSALFDGSSGYVDIPGAPFNLTTAQTTVAWVHVPTTPHFAGIMGHGDNSWRMTINTSGDPGAADGGSGDATSPASIAGGAWHLVAYSYTGVPGAVNNGALYVDGVLMANDTVPVLSGSSYDAWIGGSPDYGASRLLSGNIAHAAIFAKALTAAQIKALYAAGTNIPPVSLSLTPGATGNNPSLTWLEGTLLQATNLNGPWTTNSATSPFTLAPAAAQQFFKVLVTP